MQGGRFFNALRAFGRQPVMSTPLIRNAFELGHCVYKPLKHGCDAVPSKQKEYFLIGLSVAMKQQFPDPCMKVQMQAKAAATMTQPKQEEVVVPAKEEVEPEVKVHEEPATQSDPSGSVYWGEQSRPWNSFAPPEARSSSNIDMSQKNPETFVDQVARLAVTALRFPTDLLFRKRYFCRAAMLEAISSVPGVVNGLLLHCKSLRRCEHSGGWVKAFLEEAENERMHLMTFMELCKPSWQERAVIFAAQGLFFNTYLLLYLVSPRFAHRMVGYLGEESIQSYTNLIKDIDAGVVPNAPAPDVAIDYWKLPRDATLRDVVLSICVDQAHHRQVNHFAADVHMQGGHLKQALESR